jgi:anti-sigma regulatory factor (Ser/Thr protein kinase)
MASGGRVRPLEVRHKGVLLGVRGRGIRGLPTYREQTVRLPPGATLVLYTDGLTDRRTRADGSGHYTEAEAVALLRDAILAGASRGTAAGALALAAENAVPGDIDDDMAILVLRTSPHDLASAERVFAAEPIMVSEARRLAAATFASWHMDPDQADLACLLVSEVVTNAVLHASVTPSPAGRRFDLDIDPLTAIPAPVPVMPATSAVPAGAPGVPGMPSAWSATAAAVAAQAWDKQVAVAHPAPAHRPREFVLRLRRGAEAVWVEVFDPDLRLPRLRTARATDEGGRGLYLVEQLATRWGSRPTPEGKAVWFEIPLEGSHR